MKKNQWLALGFCLLFLGFQGISQPVFRATESNIEEVAKDIFAIYGNQITISYDEVYDGILKMVEGSVEDGCEPPFPQINETTVESISFFWDNIPEAQYYKTSYLNLNTGVSDTEETDLEDITYQGIKKLVMFGFQSHCDEGIFGPENIIIADLDMLYPVPPQAENCNCNVAERINLASNQSVDPDDPTNFPMYNWPGKCQNDKYRVSLDGTVGSSTPYFSEISFVHVPDDNVIILIGDCAINGVAQASPLVAGDAAVYNTSFITSGLNVELKPQPSFEINDLGVDVCKCGEKETGGGERSFQPEDELFYQILLYPNPVGDELNLYAEMDQPASKVTVTVLDLLGNQVAVINNIQPEDGQVRIRMNTNSWTSGIYHLNISSLTNHQTIRFSKI